MGSIGNNKAASRVYDAISNILDEEIKSNSFLGLSFVAIDHTGKTIYSGAHGHQSFAKDKPMTVDTAGWMASMTKVMTSIAAMQIVEKGLIGLDNDLAPIVPEFRDIHILTDFDQQTETPTFTKATQKITLRRLLSHSSGFAYDDGDDTTLQAWAIATGRDKDFGSGEWRAWTRPLVYEPGTSWIYGCGIDWAGKVVEILTSKSLEQYMSEHIWTPLGMTNTTFFPLSQPSIPHLDMGIRTSSTLSPGNSPWPVPVQHCMGGCGVYSTAADYARLLSALLTKDGLLLKPASIDEFFAPQLSPSSHARLMQIRECGRVQPDIPLSHPVDHGLGGLLVLEDVPGRRSKGSMCWDGMSNPNWFVDRTSGIACVLFTQLLPCPDSQLKKLYARLEEAVYQFGIEAER